MKLCTLIMCLLLLHAQSYSIGCTLGATLLSACLPGPVILGTGIACYQCTKPCYGHKDEDPGESTALVKQINATRQGKVACLFTATALCIFLTGITGYVVAINACPD